MHQDELMSLKETGQKGDFLLPYSVFNTILPDFYTTFPMHWHDEMEIVLMEDGELDECIDLEYYYVKKGDIILVNPCTLHSFKQHEDKRAKFRTIVFDFSMLTNQRTDACSVKYFTPFLEGSYISPYIISPDSPHYEELKESLKKLIRYYDYKDDFYEIQIRSELYHLFYLLFRYYFEKETHDTEIKDATTKNLKTVIDYISENYMNTITIDELAEHVHLSKHYFMRFFKKTTGMTCIEYINDYRLNVATNLLLTTGMQITEVSEKIGITNLSYFNRIFKKKYHMTPKEYRCNVDNVKKTMYRSPD